MYDITPMYTHTLLLFSMLAYSLKRPTKAHIGFLGLSGTFFARQASEWPHIYASQTKHYITYTTSQISVLVSADGVTSN